MTTAPIGWIVLDRGRADLTGQLCRVLRERILAGELGRGARLPSTRVLAKACEVSRSTVVEAYDRLHSEGFLIARRGSATRVAPLSSVPVTSTAGTSSAVSTSRALPTLRFVPGSPSLDTFPRRLWARYLGNSGRALHGSGLDYAFNPNDANLRRAICDHLERRRGVSADPERIVIMPSTGSLIDAIARAVAANRNDHEHVAWVEDPGYPPAREILSNAGFKIVGVPVDGAGLDLAQGQGQPPAILYVTPSHQYPTGVTMPLSRRLDVLTFAQISGTLILEDDYDSEFQYDGPAIAALQSIDRQQSVAYLGTLSKVLAPGLRTAYAVVPDRLIQAVLADQRLRGLAVAAHTQAALAAFIDDGHLRAHVRNMNHFYAPKMQSLRDALGLHGSRVLEISEGRGGLQLAAWFRDQSRDDVAYVKRLQSMGYGMAALSAFFLSNPRSGLLFGIGDVTEDIDQVVRSLIELFESAPMNL
jgi:GntR family transcriptional regulator/MocR family aminotransferase